MLDFAGGAVVHVNSGVAGLVCALFLGPRRGWGRDNLAPHNLALTMVGASLLWVGWIGFNAGSALAADGLAAPALINTLVASATGVAGWLLIEWAERKKPTLLGMLTGAVAGLVAITPGAGFVEPKGAFFIGLGVVSDNARPFAAAQGIEVWQADELAMALQGLPLGAAPSA